MRIRRNTSIFVLLLAVVLCPLTSAAEVVLGSSAPVNPEFLKYLENAKTGRNAAIQGEHSTGYIPSHIDHSHLKGRSPSTQARSKAILPAYYNLLDEGRVSSVKDQDPYGTCWAFATLGAIESYLMGETAGAKSAVEPDYSEMHLAWFAYTGDDSFTPVGSDPILEQGGSLLMSTALLARWTGPVNEADCPYSSTPTGDWSDYQNQKHLTDVNYLPFDATSVTSASEVKNAVMNYGGVVIHIDWANKFYDSTHFTYYNNNLSEPAVGHAVLVVGWDDNFSGALFSADNPGNGAWIVKNSWGTDWGDNGYFHLSYSDASLREGTAFIVQPTTDFDYIYDYDPLGLVTYRGNDSTTGWFANIFTAGSGRAKAGPQENLGAVSFYTNDFDCAYEIYVYTGVTAGDPDSGTLAAGPITGTLPYPGYHRVAISPTVAITNGQRFSVVVRVTTSVFKFPIPYEVANIANRTQKATANPGESFYSWNGTTWSDMTMIDATANVCLKAFTTSSTVTPTPTPTTTVTPTVTHAPTVTGGGSSGGGGCSAGMFAPFALLLFVPLFLKKF